MRCSLRSADVRDWLVPQDGLYTAVEKSPAATRRRSSAACAKSCFSEISATRSARD
jgi:hypothetical protein